MRTLSLLAVSLLAGCGGDAPADRPLAAVTVDESVEDDACALLTPALVAEAAGAPAGLDGDAFMSDMCVYSWGDNSASISQVSVYDDAEQAARRFETFTATLTRGDVREQFEAIGDQIDAQRDAGEVTDAQATAAGAMAEGFGDRAAGRGDESEVVTAYAPVSGIGDQAAISEGDKTAHGRTYHESNLWVRRGNAVFMVTAMIHRAPGDVDATATAAATRALGRAVAAHLGR